MDETQDPQLKRGYTRVAHELLEAILRYPLTLGEMKLIFALIRLTHGWGKEARQLKVRELTRIACVSQRHAKRLIKNLVRDQVFLRELISRTKVVLGLNKQFSTWRLRRIPPTPAVTTPCAGMFSRE